MILGLVVGGAVIGLLIGSFINVVAHRVPVGKSVVTPPSSCPACGHRIRPRDNVPVVSWLVLRGRCRDCGAAISARYPVVEGASAALFAVVPLVVDNLWAVPAFWSLAAAGLALTITDLDHKRIPNRILIPATSGATVLLAAAAFAHGAPGSFLRALAGGGAYFGLLFVVALVARGGFGFGDVKLAFLLGEFAAFVSWAALVVAVLAGFAIGGLVSLALLAVGKVGRKDAIPFGPAMIAGAFIAIAWGDAIADWYL